MTTLAERLARHILRDNAILFVGSSLLDDAASGSLLQQLAERLAQQIDYQGANRELAAVAQEFEVVHGRAELLRVLREEIGRLEAQAAEYYRLLATAVTPYTKIITTRFDHAVENALREIGHVYVPIVTDAEVSNFDASLIALIKLRGDIFYQYHTERDGVILTEDDLEAFFISLPTVNDVVRAFFATKTLIFIGYELDDPTFRRFFRQVTHNLGVFSRRAYALVPHDLSPRKVAYWQQNNVEVHTNLDLRAFLRELATAVQAEPLQPDEIPRQRDNPLAHLADPPRPDHPYKALESFSWQDVAIFAGRYDESRRLTNAILGHRVVVVYGESGSGKTSLLHAGAAPRLALERVLVAACTPTPGRGLEADLLEGMRAAGERAQLPAPADADVVALLRQWQEIVDGSIAVAIDQFEQLFIAYSESEQKTAVAYLQELRASGVDLRLVFVIREDFLGRLEALLAGRASLSATPFRLERLGKEAARAAIEKPAAHFGVSWAPDLVEQLLADLGEDAGVAPPQLQIVCRRLYDFARDQQPDGGPLGQMSITPAHLEALHGTTAILGDYVEGVVAALPLEQQTTARQLLGALVNSALVKQRLPLGELAQIAQTEPSTAATILDELTRRRLLQRYMQQDEPAYELIHDALVMRIVTWLGEDFWAAQRARERLRAAIAEWQRYHNLLTPGDLSLIEAQRGKLNLTPAAQRVLYAAAVAYDQAPRQWRADLSDEAAAEVLLQLTQSEEAFVRARAVRWLAAYEEGSAVDAVVAAALHDGAADVRAAAMEALAQHPQPSAVGRLVAALEAADEAAEAEHALVMMRDAAPAVDPWLPAGVRRRIGRQVRGRRWQRHWQAIMLRAGRGAVGGAIALGFGFALGISLSTFDFPAYRQLVQVAPLAAFSQAVGELFLLSGPFAVGGIVALGLGAFVTALLRYVLDEGESLIVWAGGTLATAVASGLALALFANLSSPADVSGNLGAGFLLGAVLTAVSLAPLRWPWWRHWAITAVAGLLVFLAINAIPASFDGIPLWIVLLMSVLASTGYFYAFWWKP